jgi:hypothetical protein
MKFATRMSSTKTLRPRTLNRGADDERNAILRYLKRRLKLTVYSQAEAELETNIAWIEKRVPRVRARKGGL